MNSRTRIKSPSEFAVRLDRFQVQYYPDGTPQEYRSDLSFFLNGKEVMQGACRVNDPSVSKVLPSTNPPTRLSGGMIRLKVTYNNQTTPVEVPLRTKVTLPGGEAIIIATRIEGNLEGYGPALQLAYKAGPDIPKSFGYYKKILRASQATGPQPFCH